MKSKRYLHLVIGMPGSGKTTYINESFDIETHIIVDDIMKLEDLPDPEEAAIRDIVIADVHFCNPKTLQSALGVLKPRYPDHEIRKVFFRK